MDECALYADPALYDLLFSNTCDRSSAAGQKRWELTIASEQFYMEQARESGGRVLELGCGSGRLTIPIAQEGIDIVGADLSPSMLRSARAKGAAAGLRIPFVQADMRQFDLGARFSSHAGNGDWKWAFVKQNPVSRFAFTGGKTPAAGGTRAARCCNTAHNGNMKALTTQYPINGIPKLVGKAALN